MREKGVCPQGSRRYPLKGKCPLQSRRAAKVGTTEAVSGQGRRVGTKEERGSTGSGLRRPDELREEIVKRPRACCMVWFRRTSENFAELAPTHRARHTPQRSAYCFFKEAYGELV